LPKFPAPYQDSPSLSVSSMRMLATVRAYSNRAYPCLRNKARD
jgi:hypothetical protein